MRREHTAPYLLVASPATLLIVASVMTAIGAVNVSIMVPGMVIVEMARTMVAPAMVNTLMGGGEPMVPVDRIARTAKTPHDALYLDRTSAGVESMLYDGGVADVESPCFCLGRRDDPEEQGRENKREDTEKR